MATGAVLAALMVCLFAPSSPGESLPVSFMVIVDPGHGGGDTGAAAPDGLQEKEVTLDLARKLIQVLEGQERVRWSLTRKDDYAVSLDDRAGMANHRGGDLFVSLHVGNSFGSLARGFAAYYWSPAVMVPEENDLDSAWDQGQRPYWELSRLLAELLEEELRQVLSWPSAGVSAADLYLLRRVRMPAVLLELGSVSYPAEAAELQDQEVLKNIAEAIGAAIERYEQIRAEQNLGPSGKP